MNNKWIKDIFATGYKVTSGGSDCKESACNEVDAGLIPGLRRSPEEGNGNPPQYSYLENPMESEA